MGLDMGKRADKRRSKANRRRRPHPEPGARAFDAGPIRIEQRGRFVLSHVESDADDLAVWRTAQRDFANELPDRIRDLRAELRQRLSAFDAFDAIANLWLANVPLSPDSYRESTEDGLLVIPELATCLLISRSTRAGTTGGHPFGPHAADTQEKLRELLTLEQWRVFSDDRSSEDSVFDEIRKVHRSHQLVVRGVSYPWQEQATTVELCGDGDLGDELARHMGFSANEAFRMCEAVSAVGMARMSERAQHAQRIEASLLASAQEAKETGTAPNVPTQLADQLREMATLNKRKRRTRARQLATSWAFSDIGATLSFSAEDLAARAAVPPSAVDAFLQRFSLDFGFTPDSGREPGTDDLRHRPIISDGDGNHLCCSPHHLLWAIRPAFEAAAKDAGPETWDRYEAHRRQTVERRAVAALSQALRPDWAEVGVYYDIDGGSPDRAELDGIVRADVAAFIVEAKASSMRPSARRGAPESLKGWLEGEVGRAGTQLRRARTALLNTDPAVRATLTDEHGVAIGRSLEGVEHAVELVVTLEDLPGIAPVTWRMAEAGILPTDEPPIVISLHELELICEISSRPCELVHYFLPAPQPPKPSASCGRDRRTRFLHALLDRWPLLGGRRDRRPWAGPAAVPHGRPRRLLHGTAR